MPQGRPLRKLPISGHLRESGYYIVGVLALPARPVRAPQFLLLAAALALGACAESRLLGHTAKTVTRDGTNPAPVQRKGGVYKVGNPYQIAGIWYYPKEDPSYDETGLASWYGADFHNKATANGEVFDMNEVTAAHKTLPMPSLVRVTNLENGRSIIVRVNDRGPFVAGRIIDLSRRSAQLLGMDRQGVAKVRVQMVGPASGDPNVSQPIAPPEEDKPIVVAAPRSSVSVESVAPPPGVRGQTGVVRQPAPGPASPMQAMTGTATAPAGSQPPVNLESQPVRQEQVKPTSIWVQAGAFTQFDNANRLAARVGGRVTQVLVNNQDFYRVRLGPYPSAEQADAALNTVIASGSNDARIIVD